MKKRLIVLILICLALCCGFALAEGGDVSLLTENEIDSLTAEEDFSWTLEDGTLTISGDIPDYAYGGAPWYASRKSIQEVVLNAGVTCIGSCAFYECSNLVSITIPDSVTSIGECAFCSCSSLTSITVPNVLTSIGRYAFENCSSLTSITSPDGMTSIDEWTFAGCSSLTDITIPDSVTVKSV